MAKLFANSGDPDQTSDPGLHCLLILPFYGFPDNNGLKLVSGMANSVDRGAV